MQVFSIESGNGKSFIIFSPTISSTVLHLTNLNLSLPGRHTAYIHSFIHSFCKYLPSTVYIIHFLLISATVIFSAAINLRAKKCLCFLSSLLWESLWSLVGTCWWPVKLADVSDCRMWTREASQGAHSGVNGYPCPFSAKQG